MPSTAHHIPISCAICYAKYGISYPHIICRLTYVPFHAAPPFKMILPGYPIQQRKHPNITKKKTIENDTKKNMTAGENHGPATLPALSLPPCIPCATQTNIVLVERLKPSGLKRPSFSESDSGHQHYRGYDPRNGPGSFVPY